MDLLAGIRPIKRQSVDDEGMEDDFSAEQDDDYHNQSGKITEETGKVYTTEGPDETWRIHIMEYISLNAAESGDTLQREDSLEEDEESEIQDDSSNIESQMSNSKPVTSSEEANIITSRSAISMDSDRSGQSEIHSFGVAQKREDIYDVTEKIPENCTQLFFLTFINPFGIAWDCEREEFVVWRYAKTRQWPPPFPKSSIRIKKQLEYEAELERRAEEDAKKKKIRRKKSDPFRWEIELLAYNTILSKVPVILVEEFDEDKDNNNVSLMSEDAKELYDAILIRSMQSREEKRRLKQMEIDGFSSSEGDGSGNRSGTADSGAVTARSGTAGSALSEK